MNSIDQDETEAVKKKSKEDAEVSSQTMYDQIQLLAQYVSIGGMASAKQWSYWIPLYGHFRNPKLRTCI
jgi:hypothetical protein